MTTEVKSLIERFDHLRNSGVCSPTTRSLLDDAQARLVALSTPPTDDVREGVARAIRRGFLSGVDGYSPGSDDYAMADEVLATFEVRPYGTVTDTEMEWGDIFTRLILAIGDLDPGNAAAAVMREFDVTPKREARS